jgi:hypothetical protein
MGWEMRRGKRVYYRKVREGGQVCSVYCGSGERGEQAAREDEARRCGACATDAALSQPEIVACVEQSAPAPQVPALPVLPARPQPAVPHKFRRIKPAQRTPDKQYWRKHRA